jgi:hypothetical protein
MNRQQLGSAAIIGVLLILGVLVVLIYAAAGGLK